MMILTITDTSDKDRYWVWDVWGSLGASFMGCLYSACIRIHFSPKMNSIIHNFASIGGSVIGNAASDFIINDISNPILYCCPQPSPIIISKASFTAMPNLTSPPTILTDLFDYFSLFVYHFSLNQTLTATVSQIR